MKFDLDSKSDWAALLEKLGACQDAIADNTARPFREAWEQSVSGKQLLWLASRVQVPAPLLRLAACDCARTALQYVPPDEHRPREAIETAERYARGEATAAELDAARAAARDAANKRITDLVRARIPFEAILRCVIEKAAKL